MMTLNNVGMTPVQALQTASIGSAKAIKMDHQIGSIEKGKYLNPDIWSEKLLSEIHPTTWAKYKNDLNYIKFFY